MRWRRGLAGLFTATQRRWCGGRRRVRRAWLRCPWAVVGPGRTTSRRTEPHISDQAPPVRRAPEGPEGARGPAAAPVGGGGAWPDNEPTRRATHQRPGDAGEKGAGGTGGRKRACCGARGRWRGLAGLRDDAPSGARGADGERAGRRPRAHQAARPDESGPTAPGTPAAPQAPCKKLELLVVLRVLVGLAAVGAAECTDRRHLLRR